MFSCFVLLFAVFSSPVNAEDLDTSTSKANVTISGYNAGVTFGQVDVNNGDTGTVSGEVYHNLSGSVILQQRLIIANNDGSILMRSDSNYDFILENITFEASYKDDNGNTGSFNLNDSNNGSVFYYFVYADGSSSVNYSLDLSGDNFSYHSIKKVHNYKLDISAEKDILRVVFVERLDLQPLSDFETQYGYVYLTGGFDYAMKLSIENEDESVGLLGGILEWIKGIFDKIGDMFDVISSGFANIGTWFAELPGKIWNVIETGLKNLFVPDESYMSTYSDKWQALFSVKLGAVYQVGDIVIDSWDEIISADQTDSINIPLVSIPLPDNNTFSFGGYTVKIVPEGFQELVNALKLIIGILCTYVFFNGMLSRYDEIMGVEK